MATIKVNFNNEKGKIKPMHAVGQPPFAGGFNKLDVTPMQILKDAHIPYSRLHDVGGPFGGNRYVDIPNIFRDFDADETLPQSYDFTFTDELIKGMMSYNVKPYFRLGVTIENQANIKAYRIFPPKDYDKWARICEHIIRHYNEGWANGFYFDITYWEIWNEPENRETPEMNQLWRGTANDYYRLYDVTAKHLKKCFGDKIKVGGYGACGFYGIFANPEKHGLDVPKREEERYNTAKEEYRVKFFYDFVEYISKNNSPIDFFSWHTYGGIDIFPTEADFVDKVLTKYGYGDIETHVTEWNLSHNKLINKGTSYASSNDLALMIAMHDKKTDMLMYYDARYVAISAYAGFYDVVTCKPSCVYYAFKVFGELYNLGTWVESIDDRNKGVYAIASKQQNKKALLISNVSDKSRKINTNLDESFTVYLVDQKKFIEKTIYNPTSFTLKKHQIALIKNF